MASTTTNIPQHHRCRSPQATKQWARFKVRPPAQTSALFLKGCTVSTLGWIEKTFIKSKIKMVNHQRWTDRSEMCWNSRKAWLLKLIPLTTNVRLAKGEVFPWDCLLIRSWQQEEGVNQDRDKGGWFLQGWSLGVGEAVGPTLRRAQTWRLMPSESRRDTGLGLLTWEIPPQSPPLVLWAASQKLTSCLGVSPGWAGGCNNRVGVAA